MLLAFNDTPVRPGHTVVATHRPTLANAIIAPWYTCRPIQCRRLQP